MTSVESSLTALTRYHVRSLESTVLQPVVWVWTMLGRISSNSWAITPSCIPSLFIVASLGSSGSTSSDFLYSKLRTWILFSTSSPVLLFTIFFLILRSDVVLQVVTFCEVNEPLSA